MHLFFRDLIMNRKDAQEERERCIFREFAGVCPLEVNEESIKSGDEEKKEPDIHCHLKDGSGLPFELTEAVDGNIPKKDNLSKNKKPLDMYA